MGLLFIVLLAAANAFLVYKLHSSSLWALFAGEGKPSSSPLKEKGWTLDELRLYNGLDRERILIAIKGRVYDVTDKGRAYYGPGRERETPLLTPTMHIGGSYAVLAGEDASRALAVFKLPSSKSELRANGHDLSDMTEEQLEALDGWIEKFDAKYCFIGPLL